MTRTEAARTLRYLFRPLSTHIHILLVSCLLVALGLGTLQNGSSGQGKSKQQAAQTPGSAQLSTSPLGGQQSGSGHTDVSGTKNGSSGSYKTHSKPQLNVHVPAPLSAPDAASETPGATSQPSCDTGDCPTSPQSAVTSPTAQPSADACNACSSPPITHHSRVQRLCQLSCQTISP